MALSYGRVVAKFATFQDGHTPVGTVEFVPSDWVAESGIIHSPAPVIGWVREDGQLYGSEKAYASETPGVKLLVSDPSRPARYTATPAFMTRPQAWESPPGRLSSRLGQALQVRWWKTRAAVSVSSHRMMGCGLLRYRRARLSSLSVMVDTRRAAYRSPPVMMVPG